MNDINKIPINDHIEFLRRSLENYLNMAELQDNGDIILRLTKGLVGKVKDLRFIIHTDDHEPFHFHVESLQRHIDAKIRIDNLEPCTGSKISKGDLKIIRKFYAKEAEYRKLKEASIRLSASKTTH